MGEFRVEIAGICCHYTLFPGFIRTILVAADQHQHPHYAHLEVQAEGIVNSAGLQPLSQLPQYSRSEVTYQAYRLDGHRISFDNVVNLGPPHMHANFETDVPRITNVCRTFGFDRIRTFAGQVPPAGSVAAQIDIATGDLRVIEKSDPVHFVPPFNHPPDDPGADRRLGTVTALTLTLPGAATQPTIYITPFQGVRRALVLQPWVTRIRIGNLGRSGMLGHDEIVGKHFEIYYLMADPGANCTAIPVEPVAGSPGKGLGGGCANNVYP
jgi:hypothetical protein